MLLIVRELLAGPSRYSDIRRGLPGIASNLLAERLKAMAAEGLIEHREAPAPDRRQGLRADPARPRARGGAPSPDPLGAADHDIGALDDDAVQPQWTALLAGLTLTGTVPADAPTVIGLERPDCVRVVLRHDGFEIERGLGDDADVTLRGSALLVGGLISGQLTALEATDMGLTIEGRADLLADLVDTHRTPRGATQ